MKDDSLPAGGMTKYALIAGELREAIVGGRMLPNEQLPPFPVMLERFGVAKHTLERAYALLEQQGLIRREQGRGVFVQPRNASTEQQPAKKKSSGYIGYLDLWPEYSSHSPYVLQLQKGMRQEASEANKRLVLVDSPGTFSQWDDLDGLLLCEGGKIDRAELRRMLPAGLPVVNLLHNDPVYPSVVPDDAQGLRLLVEHLISQGHERIGYLGYYRTAPVNVRHQAYRETMLRNRLEPLDEWSRMPDSSLAGSFCRAGHLGMQSWLSDGFLSTGCTAVLAQNDQCAYGMMRALGEADIRVPEEISIAGFDGVPQAVLDGSADEYWQPLQLATIRVPLCDIAAVAMKVLLGEEAAPAVGEPRKLPVKLQTGESISLLSKSRDAVCVE